MELVFNHRMFRHINESAIKERGRAARFTLLAEKVLRYNALAWPLALLDHFAGLVLTLPVPIYSGIVYAMITSTRYCRSLPLNTGRCKAICPSPYIALMWATRPGKNSSPRMRCSALRHCAHFPEHHCINLPHVVLLLGKLS